MFKKVTDSNDCVSHRRVLLHKCQGYCGDVADDCCQPASHRSVKVTLRCPDGNHTTIEVCYSYQLFRAYWRNKPFAWVIFSSISLVALEDNHTHQSDISLVLVH